MKLITGLMLLIVGTFGYLALSPVYVSAQFNPLQTTCESGPVNGSSVCKEAEDPTDPITSENGAIFVAANLLAIVGGIIATIILIVTGIRMVTSGGDPNTVRSTRNAIIYTVIGVLVILFARIIIQLVFGRIIRS